MRNYCRGVAASRTPAFRGRLRERRVLDHLLDGVREGESAVLVIRGEAGVGKTACCTTALAKRRMSGRSDRGRRIRAGAAVRGAAPAVPPMLGGLAALPEPQHEALRVAFGLMTGTAPDRFLVGLAVLSLLAEVGARAAAGVSRRRCPMARRRVRTGPGVRGPAAAGRIRRCLLFAVREAGDGADVPGPAGAECRGARPTATPGRC